MTDRDDADFAAKVAALALAVGLIKILPRRHAMADVPAIVHRLEAAGDDRDVAGAHVAAIQTAVDDRREHLATKADLEARLTWRMIGLQIAAVGLIIAGLKFIA